MSGLLFLEDSHFKIMSSPQKGQVLGTTIRGVSLILFYSTRCKYCDEYIPIFKKLPGTVGGCQFGMINIAQNRSVVELSKNTNTPFKYVPYIVLYIDGFPVMSYDGPADENKIRTFIIKMVEDMNAKQQFITNKPEEPVVNPIPAYTIGRPKDADRCYVNWDAAYST